METISKEEIMDNINDISELLERFEHRKLVYHRYREDSNIQEARETRDWKIEDGPLRALVRSGSFISYNTSIRCMLQCG